MVAERSQKLRQAFTVEILKLHKQYCTMDPVEQIASGRLTSNLPCKKEEKKKKKKKTKRHVLPILFFNNEVELRQTM